MEVYDSREILHLINYQLPMLFCAIAERPVGTVGDSHYNHTPASPAAFGIAAMIPDGMNVSGLACGGDRDMQV